MSNKTKIIENPNYPGFYQVPAFLKCVATARDKTEEQLDFSNYALSREGVLLNHQTGSECKASPNHEGYYQFTAVADNGIRYALRRNRLLCLVFKYVEDHHLLTVDHVNGIVGDDYLDNLEWVTIGVNVRRAHAVGNIPMPIRVSTRNTNTMEVRHYDSIMKCANKLKVSRSAIEWRLSKGDTWVFPDYLQYRRYSEEVWDIPNDVELAMLRNYTHRAILVKKLLTGEVMQFDKIMDFCKLWKISQATASTWLHADGQPVRQGCILIKFAIDTTPWREIEDPYLELAKFGKGYRPIKVVNVATNEIEMYERAVDCARAHNLSPTNLNYKLSIGSDKIFNGFRYGYYPY